MLCKIWTLPVGGGRMEWYLERGIQRKEMLLFRAANKIKNQLLCSSHHSSFIRPAAHSEQNAPQPPTPSSHLVAVEGKLAWGPNPGQTGVSELHWGSPC